MSGPARRIAVAKKRPPLSLFRIPHSGVFVFLAAPWRLVNAKPTRGQGYAAVDLGEGGVLGYVVGSSYWSLLWPDRWSNVWPN